MTISHRILAFRLVIIFFVLTIHVTQTAGNGQASEMSPLEIAETLQQRYDATKTFSADFQQFTTMKLSRRDRRGAGTVVIKKPDSMRWDYTSPDRQVIISDGKTLTMYFAKNTQMIVGPARQYLESDITYAFFTGTGNILRDFEVFPPDLGTRAMPGAHCIKLVPRKPHPQVDFLHVWVTAETFLIHRIMIVDQLGSVTDLLFSNITTDQEIPPDLFVFTPPPDTEIIEQ
ncbi:MAG: outer membrane lipoprotein carrier protein LolA [Desulfobulbaceae bacterium]|nr:outer membrane lipoprotein carrier protein LolA [Desulfobulbaceae bacterium]